MDASSLRPLRVAAVIPAYDAATTVLDVVRGLRERWPWNAEGSIIVVDDGSHDSTAELAGKGGATVLRHSSNRGKGAALRTGFAKALAIGADAVVSVDADGQHLPDDAIRLALHPVSVETLILGVRDLVEDGAPRMNRFSNGISNFFLSRFTRLSLNDTQCGLRRYPLRATMALGCLDDGYAFEAECVLRAARERIPIVEVPVRVYYPPEHLRVTHFHSVKDPARIVYRVVTTLATRQP